MDLGDDEDGSCVATTNMSSGGDDPGLTLANDTMEILIVTGKDRDNDAITSLLPTGSFLWFAALSILTVCCAIYIFIMAKKKTAAVSALASMGKQSSARDKKKKDENGETANTSRPNAPQPSERNGRPVARPSLHRRSSFVGAISQFTNIDLGQEEKEEKPSRGPRRWDDDDELDHENGKGIKGASKTRSSLRMSLRESILSFNSSLQARQLENPDIPHVPRPPLPGMHPDYPFENLVFQGGGAKGVIYGGVALALDEIGVTPYLKRFAGASAGSIAALAMALGLDGKQVEKELSAVALEKIIFQDSRGSGGRMSTLSSGLSFLNSLGVHDGTEIHQWLGDMVEKYSGNRDLTFLELFRKHGVELCVSVSNLSRVQGELCHVNTTPHLPIREAVRASLSIPFLMKPYEMGAGESYIDGGIFDNFPLKAFDGWNLSTGKQSLFTQILEKNDPEALNNISTKDALRVFQEGLETKTAKVNDATVGFCAFQENSADEEEFQYYTALMNIQQGLDLNDLSRDVDKIPFPSTPKAKSHRERSEDKHAETNEKYVEAYIEMIRWVIAHSSHFDSSQANGSPQSINTDLLVHLLHTDPPGKQFHPDVFGMASWSSVINAVDQGSKGFVILRKDVGSFFEKYNVNTHELQNRRATSISSAGDLGGGVLQALFSAQTGQVFKDESNAKRICPLSTVYIGTFDADMQQKDKDYLFAVGKCMVLTWMHKKYPKAQEQTLSIPSLELSSHDSSSTSRRSSGSTQPAAEERHFVQESFSTDDTQAIADDDKSVKSALSKKLTRLNFGTESSPPPLVSIQQEPSTFDGEEEDADCTDCTQVPEHGLQSIEERTTSITFAPKLNDLYLVGVGVRTKAAQKIYAVAMYSPPSVLIRASSPASLASTVRSFNNELNPKTIFVLEIVYSATANEIAAAIAQSLQPRHQGSSSQLEELESLIINGINESTSKFSTLGASLHFDCSRRGLTVSVNGSLQGSIKSEEIGSAFVDIYMDSNTVSPSLIESCVKTWSGGAAKALASSLLGQTEVVDESLDGSDVFEGLTGIAFKKSFDGLELIGTGVRKRAFIQVYAIAMYGSPSVAQATTRSALHDAARSFNDLTPQTSFLLKFAHSVGSGAFADSLRTRHEGPDSDIEILKNLIVAGISSIGGHAIKDTTFRFDCSKEGVAVTIDGLTQGTASFEELGTALVDAFLDAGTVCPTLVEDCIKRSLDRVAQNGEDVSSQGDSQLPRVSSMDFTTMHSGTENSKSSGSKSSEYDEFLSFLGKDKTNTAGSSLTAQKADGDPFLSAVDDHVKSLKDPSTGVTFDAKLERNGLYLAGVGV
ncbi:hypothetical protein THAOC_16823 [Thalassiosira oceanica]|uniref:PNPLA domain-containing protein n=1 Tax=Thalassiosira oceanica TaxID=159749 RepID=K0SB72_THAOC|nr:hypothetical protein THAOC_16823 [Thalassiosira oceanica]|eukprot:EJK62560.1 hypothetical protein THAOC_16823 [Thalassiosira oceanica]